MFKLAFVKDFQLLIVVFFTDTAKNKTFKQEKNRGNDLSFVSISLINQCIIGQLVLLKNITSLSNTTRKL